MLIFCFHQFSLLGWPNDSFQNCHGPTQSFFVGSRTDSLRMRLCHIFAETPGQLRIETEGKEPGKPDMWHEHARNGWIYFDTFGVGQNSIVASLFCMENARFLRAYSSLPALSAANLLHCCSHFCQVMFRMRVHLTCLPSRLHSLGQEITLWAWLHPSMKAWPGILRESLRSQYVLIREFLNVLFLPLPQLR